MALSPTEEAQVRSLIAQNPALLNLAASESTIISKLGATKTNLSALAAATSLSDADIALVRQGLSDKSFAMSVLLDYVKNSLPAASTTSSGVVELATNAETQTGTDAQRVVTPAGLASVVSSVSLAGLIKIASTAQAQALTDDTAALTAKKLADAFAGGALSLVANGYQKLPGGLIIQWGGVDFVSASQVSVSWPLTFPNAVLMAGCVDKATGSNAGTGLAWRSDLTTLSTGVFSAASAGAGIASFFAFGY